MNALVWNARGLGSSRAFHELRRLLTDNSPSLIFICETKLRKYKCERWKSFFNYDGLFIVDAEGSKGGLILMWKAPLDVTIRSYSKGHIDSIVVCDDIRWRFTGFYGNPETGLRSFSWELLNRLANDLSLQNFPWVVGGDFNEILFQSEKVGGCSRSNALMQAFRDTMTECGLFNVDRNNVMTWFNNRTGSDAVAERLDRFLVNDIWRMSTPNFKVLNLDFYGSDHRPLFLRVLPRLQDRASGGLKRFYFEEKWLLDESFAPNFLAYWEEFNGSDSLPVRLKHCQNFLHQWAGDRFDKIGHRLKDLRKHRLNLLNQASFKDNRAQLLKVNKEIECLLDVEESHWKARARTNWLCQGDRNTTTFHAYASARKRKNTIEGLENDNGDWITKNDAIAGVVKGYFEDLFMSSQPTDDVIRAVTYTIVVTINEDDSSKLDEVFSSAEVKRAVFDMHPSKSPGPDGFSSRFFQKLWPVVGDDITKDVLGVLNQGDDFHDWNKTLIILIPKKNSPRSVKDYRPISLCNTVYKIVSKVIVNRLRRCLHDVIDENQSAFVSGRQISDNIIVGFECMHWLQKKGRKSSFAALKLDMSKAYDRVEWKFVEAILKQLNFPTRICQLIMRCITTVSYSFIVNGRSFGETCPTRGLRQGDPLSPLLFVLCAQGFSSLLHQTRQRGLFQGIRFGSNGPTISHLLFADDSLLFFQAHEGGADAILNCLNKYARASGQLINFEKSAISFSPSSPDVLIQRIKNIIGLKVVQGHVVYLGLPTISLRKKRLQFGYLHERVTRKLALWKNKSLSTGGKEVLIKSVIQAIPTYAMTCFRIPESICADINRECARFWWGDTTEKNRLHWSRWELLCQPKDRGGLGFRHLTSFNKALLAKQVWRLLHNPSTLMARVMKAKYYRTCSILEARAGSNASFIWRSLCWSRPVIVGGLRWKVATGTSIRALHDVFVEDIPFGIPCARENELGTVKLNHFITPTREWDLDRLKEFFWPSMVNYISRTPIVKEGEDRCYWKYNEKGVFSVKSGYLEAIGYYSTSPFMSKHFDEEWESLVWKPNLPPKIKIFFWRALKDFLPSMVNLRAHHVPVTGLCDLCGSDWGTTLHSLFFCSSTKKYWKETIYWKFLKKKRNASLLDIGRDVKNCLTQLEYEIWVVTMWYVWFYICQKKHGNVNESMEAGPDFARGFLASFHAARRAFPSRMKFGVEVGTRKWFPMKIGRFRLDVDAAYNTTTNSFGVGAVVRDSNGKVCAALAKQVARSDSVLGAELTAVLYGLGLCLQENLGPILLFSDSLLAVQVLHEIVDVSIANPDFICRDYPELVELVEGGFVIDFCHMYREANTVAHNLARFGAGYPQMCTWTSDCPSWLTFLANQDL